MQLEPCIGLKETATEKEHTYADLPDLKGEDSESKLDEKEPNDEMESLIFSQIKPNFERGSGPFNSVHQE